MGRPSRFDADPVGLTVGLCKPETLASRIAFGSSESASSNSRTYSLNPSSAVTDAGPISSFWFNHRLNVLAAIPILAAIIF